VAAEDEAAGKDFGQTRPMLMCVASARLDCPAATSIATLTLMLQSLPCKLKLPVSARSSDG
jgi:hypothetical protein